MRRGLEGCRGRRLTCGVLWSKRPGWRGTAERCRTLAAVEAGKLCRGEMKEHNHRWFKVEDDQNMGCGSRWRACVRPRAFLRVSGWAGKRHKKSGQTHLCKTRPQEPKLTRGRDSPSQVTVERTKAMLRPGQRSHHAAHPDQVGARTTPHTPRAVWASPVRR
jgi:hypothetical protein